MKLELTREIQVNLEEAMRYLRTLPDETLNKDLLQAAQEILSAAKPVAAAVCLPLEEREDHLACGNTPLKGNAIKKHFANCQRVIIIGVSLGFQVDRAISTAGQISPYRGLLLDACATAAIEDLADLAEEISIEAFAKGENTTWRFSPGYGDLPLETQRPLLEELNARRTLGLTLGQSLLLSPIKSVTAFIGVSSQPCKEENRKKCQSCSMQKSCPYKKIEDNS